MGRHIATLRYCKFNSLILYLFLPILSSALEGGDIEDLRLAYNSWQTS